MNLATWSIRKPVPSILFFTVATLLGAYSFKTLPIQENPDFDLPIVNVAISLPGATATSLETEVTRKVEDAIAGLPEVKHITSVVTEGQSVTAIEFNSTRNPQEALTDTTDAVNRLRPVLPQDSLAPVVTKMTTSGQPISTYSIEFEGMSETELAWFVDNTLAKRLMVLQGASKVVRQGGADREVQVKLNGMKMAALGLSPAEVSKQLYAAESDSSAGRADLDGTEQTIRFKGAAKLVADLDDYVLTFSGGQRVRLGDIATITDGPAEQRQVALLDGKPVVSLSVYRSQGYSAVELENAVRAELNAITASNPGFKYTVLVDRVSRVKNQYAASMQSLYEGTVMAILVVFLFLKDIRATFIASTAIPLSLVPTFYLMQLMDFSINGVTLLSLVLVIGIVVDDAIVEIENIFRHLKMGKSPIEAAKDAVTEIGLAVMATTFTLIAVFLPTAFMGGIVGKFFKQFGWTAAFAIFVSFLVARLLTPLLAAYGMKGSPAHEEKPGRVMKKYMKALDYSLAHPYLVSIVSVVFVAVSLVLAAKLPSGFVPPSDRDALQISVELPPGSTMTDTLAITEEVRKRVSVVPSVVSVYSAIGTGKDAFMTQSAGSAAEVRKASVTLNLKPLGSRPSSSQIEKEVRAQIQSIAGARLSVGSGQANELLTVVLSGDDSESLENAASQVANEIRGIAGIGGVTSSAGLSKNELVIQPDYDKMAQLGVNAQVLAQVVRVATVGDYNVSLPKLNLAERQLYIRVKLDDVERQNIDSIRQLRIPSREGSVPLSSVAEVEVSSGPLQISRYDRYRNVTLSVELSGTPMGGVLKSIQELPSIKNLPEGVRMREGGGGELKKELFDNFIPAIMFSIIAVYAVMVLLFQAFLQPLTIIAALPLSIGGAFGALALGNMSLSMPSLIGLIMLMGVVAKNSILLVEYAQMVLEQGVSSPVEAMKEACLKRARPILMTSIAMIAGMLPIIFGMQGADSSFQKPMAVVLVGGLTTSTLLSLLVVPVIFVFMHKLSHLRGLKAKIV